LKRAAGRDYRPTSPNSPPLRKNLAAGERSSAPTVAPMSRRRISTAIEGPCRGEGCAKLLTLRIVDICSQGFYFGRPVPASELAASILADFRKALPARIDATAANAATPIRLIAGNNIILSRINICTLLIITVIYYLNIVLLSFFAV
jgi:hypothetical protein